MPLTTMLCGSLGPGSTRTQILPWRSGRSAPPYTAGAYREWDASPKNFTCQQHPANRLRIVEMINRSCIFVRWETSARKHCCCYGGVAL